ncbi:MAG: 1-acyl-sn-glycerol-3-phosphate acyltransferase [Pseudomonadota bacterium]
MNESIVQTAGPTDAEHSQQIVDQLIEERAHKLRQRSWLWPLVKRLFYPVLGYQRAISVIGALQPLRGQAVLDWLSRELQMQVEVEGLEHVPEDGHLVIVANHPAGIADGIAVWDALKQRREDISFFANRDAIRAVKGLEDVIIPVEWVQTRRTHERSREMVRQTLKAFRSNRLIVIFPSGRLAQPTIGGLKEREWMTTAVSLAQKYNSPIVPMHIRGRNSLLYYLLYFLNEELRDMTLFRELLNKRFQKYTIRLGRPFLATGESRDVTTALQRFVAEDMARGATHFNHPDHAREPLPDPVAPELGRVANGE